MKDWFGTKSGEARGGRQRFRLPTTLYGLPVEEDGLASVEARRLTKKKGVALIIAIMIISIMMLFSSDLIVNSQVSLELAATHRDSLKAEYMAKSAFNAALLLLSSDFAYDLYQLKLNPKGELKDGMGDIWTAMNGLPIGGETAEMLEGFQEHFELNTVMDSGVMDQLKLFDGSFVLDVTDEQQKINVNFCAQGRCQETLYMLEALFSCPAEKTFLEQKKIVPQELAYKIKDWVDVDSRAEEASGVSDEDDPYSRRVPKLRAKNAPFDSLDELRLIDGWDEEVHAVFSPFMTVFPFQEKGLDKQKININTASRALLGCLFPEARGECTEKSTLALAARNEDKVNLGGEGKKIPDILRETLCYTGDGDTGEASNRANWFAQNSMVFRIEARGYVGKQEKVLSAVVERVMPDLKKKEKAAYKLLYYKVM